MLLFLILNINIKLITCDPSLEIPPIKKTLQEYRKKMWHDYHHKLLVQCMDGPNIHRSRNILSMMEVLEHLYQCLVTEHDGIYKAPLSIKEIKIHEMALQILETTVITSINKFRIR